MVTFYGESISMIDHFYRLWSDGKLAGWEWDGKEEVTDGVWKDRYHPYFEISGHDRDLYPDLIQCTVVHLLIDDVGRQYAVAAE